MPETTTDIQRYVQRVIAQASPHSLLELTPLAGITTDRPPVAQHQCYTLSDDAFDWTRIADATPLDRAVIIDAPCDLCRTDVEHPLAYLKNTGTGPALAVQTTNMQHHLEPWRIKDFLASGLRQANAHTGSYRRIAPIDLTPSWLNANHWANPERGDQQR